MTESCPRKWRANGPALHEITHEVVRHALIRQLEVHTNSGHGLNRVPPRFASLSQEIPRLDRKARHVMNLYAMFTLDSRLSLFDRPRTAFKLANSQGWRAKKRYALWSFGRRTLASACEHAISRQKWLATYGIHTYARVILRTYIALSLT